MVITTHGQSFELRFEENVGLMPELARKLAHESAKESSPAGDALPQALDLRIRIDLPLSA